MLQEQIIRQLHQNSDVEVIEFYGAATAGWTHKWTSDVRPMHHLNYYRNAAVQRSLKWLKALRAGADMRGQQAPQA